MPRNKDVKRIIRSRMKKTGESYTAARAQILSKATPRNRRALTIDYRKLAGMKDETIAAKTGRGWNDWIRALDADGATAMRHGDIARLLSEKYAVADWWAQMVTVGYERIKGRRERGQRLTGAYEASKSKTYSVPMSTLFDAWADDRVRRRWLDGINTVVRTATPPKSMRLGFPDGTIVAVWFTAKGSKSAVALAHTKLRDRAAAEEAKQFWSERLDTLAAVLDR
jgi:hypothetical protein